MKRPLNTIALFVTLTISLAFAMVYGNKRDIFYGDSLGYYYYLPAGLLYHNLQDMYSLPPNKDTKAVSWYASDDPVSPTGHLVNQYTYGIALMELPFFVAAQGYEKMTGLSSYGFSNTDNLFIKFSSLLYSFLGLILIYKILRNYFDHTRSLLVTLCIFIGTNLFWFTLYQAGMAHVPLFFLYALLIYLTIQLHKKPKTSLFIGIGFIMGLITLIRPTDVLCIFIPLLYNVYNKETWHAKMLLLKNNIFKFIPLIIAFIVPIIPQLLYWKLATGRYIYYSYGHQQFDWAHPKIGYGLFYGGNGWLVYTPIMIFALFGMLLFRRIKLWAWCLWLILPAYIYIIYSWGCYNYINGLGSRPMIHLYPLLAIPLTAFLQYTGEKRLPVKILAGIAVLFCISINISFSMQQAKGVLISEGATVNYNLHTLYRMNLTYRDLVLFDDNHPQPDAQKLTRVATLAWQHYDDSTSPNTIASPTNGSKYVYHMGNDEFQPDAIHIKLDKQYVHAGNWFKCSARFMYPYPPGMLKHNFVFVIKRGDSTLVWQKTTVENKIGVTDDNKRYASIYLQQFKTNTWDTVHFYIKVPKGIQEGDDLAVSLWNIGKQDIYMDDVCLELYK